MQVFVVRFSSGEELWQPRFQGLSSLLPWGGKQRIETGGEVATVVPAALTSLMSTARAFAMLLGH